MKVKIVEIADAGILFDNGWFLYHDHTPDCCEYNYADWKQLEHTGIENEKFDLKDDALVSVVDDHGIKIRAISGYAYFVPCYSDQSGYYSDEVEIRLHDGKKKSTLLLTTRGKLGE